MFKLRLASSIMALGLGFTGSVIADDRIPVVTSFSILGDLVSEVGQEHIKVTNLVKIDGDAHVFTPSPLDAKAISEAKLVVINGLQFEGWMPRLIEAANYKGVQVVATHGIEGLRSENATEHEKHDNHEHHDDDEHHEHQDNHERHDDDEHHEHHDSHEHQDAHENHDDDEHHEQDSGHDHHHGDVDPHAWHSINNVKIYVKNIAQGLSQVDPANAADYRANAKSYVQKLDKLALKLNNQLSQIPESQRIVITPHDAFGYFARDFNITFLAPQGTSTGSEASAADVAALIKQIRRDKVNAVFMENIADNRLIEQISRETNAKVGGKLYSDALSAADKPAATYLQMMQYNVDTITAALAP